MSQSKPMEPYAMRMALEVLARDAGVERVNVTDYEDYHVTFARGVYTVHYPHYTDTGTLTEILTDILDFASSTAHFEIVRYDMFADMRCNATPEECAFLEVADALQALGEATAHLEV